LHKQNASDFGSCPSIAANVSKELVEMYETQFFGLTWRKSIFSIELACSAQFKTQKRTQTIVPANYEQNCCCIKLHSEEIIITNKSSNKFQYPTATKLLAANLTNSLTKQY
jgi:hypothetical protein